MYNMLWTIAPAVAASDYCKKGTDSPRSACQQQKPAICARLQTNVGDHYMLNSLLAEICLSPQMLLSWHDSIAAANLTSAGRF